jgi:MOSC domain-containing protein YiiM
VNDALIGERWQIGTAVLEVSEPRIPCWRLGVRMHDDTFPRRFVKRFAREHIYESLPKVIWGLETRSA